MTLKSLGLTNLKNKNFKKKKNYFETQLFLENSLV